MIQNAQHLLKNLLLFIFGGSLYCVVELLYRGYTHWTMFFLGAGCFVTIGLINEYIEWHIIIWKQMLIGSVIITVLEFICGCVVNLLLGWNVWDYSNLPLNLFGQICLPFSIVWFGISFFAIIVDDVIRWKLFGEEKPHYRWK